jgi:hypothetical protein
VERHRSQARVAVPQLADHGVTAPELGEAAPVHVKRQDAFDLGDDPVLVVDVAGELDRDGAAPLPVAAPTGGQSTSAGKARRSTPGSVAASDRPAGAKPSRKRVLAAKSNAPRTANSVVIVPATWTTTQPTARFIPFPSSC